MDGELTLNKGLSLFSNISRLALLSLGERCNGRLPDH